MVFYSCFRVKEQMGRAKEKIAKQEREKQEIVHKFKDYGTKAKARLEDGEKMIQFVFWPVYYFAANGHKETSSSSSWSISNLFHPGISATLVITAKETELASLRAEVESSDVVEAKSSKLQSKLQSRLKELQAEKSSFLTKIEVLEQKLVEERKRAEESGREMQHEN